MTCAPRCSVIVCAKDDETRLPATLDSIRRQACLGDIEVVFVEGASTDRTLELMEDVASTMPTTVVSSARDGGIYQAMNRGISLASGDLLYFLNCGDRFSSDDALASVLAQVPHSPTPPLVVCRVRHHGGGVRAPFVTSTVPFSRARLVLARQDYNHQAMLFGREASRSAGGFEPSFGVVSDYHLILRLALLARPVPVDVVLTEYEGGGVSAQRPFDIPRLQAAARNEVFDLSGPARLVNLAYGAATALRRRELSSRR